MINRTSAPDSQKIERLDISNYKKMQLDNETALYYVDGVEEDLVRIEMRFHAGRWYESQHCVSRAVCNLMKKGTKSKTAKQIADIIEFYGAQLEVQQGQDLTSVVIFCLGKYLDAILPVVEEILAEASFAQDELEHFIEKQKQKLRINAQNTDFHANRKFHSVLFGAQHPYGYALTEPDLDELNSELLLHYHRKHYNPADAVFFLAGNINESVIKKVNQYFGKYSKTGILISNSDKSIHTDPEDFFFIDRSDSVQSSVRIGGLTISKTHPDFAELNVLNTAFGGYFGSRLMTNIREDKGYTYGIYSSITHFNHASYFSIETETGNEVCEKAIAEIYNEMEKMRTTLIDDEELTIIKNYMMGGLLRATDGPFNRINVIKNMVMSRLDTGYFEGLVNAIRTVQPERLRDLAIQYFDRGTMKEVVCGHKE